MKKASLKEIVSKAFCINLYYRNDRWYYAQDQFVRNDLNVERFNAIDGREFAAERYPMKVGNLGCNLSHYLIITAAMIMGLDAIMVFEDDIVLAENFTARMDECLQDLPQDWDMIMLGGNHQEKTLPVTDRLHRVQKSFTTHAYIIRFPMYEALLQRMQAFDQPMDNILSGMQPVWNVFVTNPPMAWQRAGYSDIEGRAMNYDFLKSNEQ